MTFDSPDRHFLAKLATIHSEKELRGFEKGLARQARLHGRKLTTDEIQAVERRKDDIKGA